MAAHNAPKHDFAPAWLKIPSQENPKPSGSKQLEDKSRPRPYKDDYYSRHGPDYARLHRQHSFENFYDGKRGGGSGKFRHHSVEDEYYPYPYGPYGYYNSYGMPYSSNPSVFRSPPNRDSKYPQHPSLRYGQMNGAYPGYYDLYNFDYYHGDPYFSSYPGNRERAGSKRSHYEKDGRSNSKDGKEKENEKTKGDGEEEEKPTFQEDFPSLNGEEEKHNSKVTNGGGVWEHPPHGKGGSSKFGERGQAANIYKSLVPNKSAVTRKPSKENARFNGSYSSASKSLTPSGVNTPREGSRQSPTPPIEILNTRLVTQPRNLGDKKSDFLRTLRTGSNSSSSDGSQQHMRKGYGEGLDKLSNGVDNLHLEESSQSLLSSSLEAEQRLLKEMGWTENDDEDYEITEDDKKKFQDLCSKQVQAHKNNGRLSKTLSPKHVAIYQANVQELNDTLSSSDSDSEDNM
ncbi:hypothetical protein FSP39_001937 [Pinctada imbricata]|uniref:Vasculin n=1 Tax=Pinctada imbricata TaxID=66713 RepID=A0AA88XPE3_PINIB|nr:hypothetical protein FSP39_001937 [Pinctada imbricata]